MLEITYIAAEVEPKRQTTTIEIATESAISTISEKRQHGNDFLLPSMGVFPFAVDNPKCNVFIGRACNELEQYGVVITRFFDDLVCWRFRLVNEVRIEDVELRSKKLVVVEIMTQL